jgi:hypothetical protein
MRKLLADSSFGTSWQIDSDVTKLSQHNTKNQRAVEYAMAVALTYQQHSVIIPDIDSLLSNFSYSHIPRHLEEALLIEFGYGENPEMTREKILDMEFGGLKIRKETIDRCDEFFKQLDRYHLGMTSWTRIRDRFGDTYWFHFLFTTLKPIELRGQNTYEIS